MNGRNPGRSGRGTGVRWRRVQVRLRSFFNRVPLRENQKLHLLTFLIGGLCGLAAVAFHWLLESCQSGIIYRVAGTPGPWRLPLLILVPALGGLLVGSGSPLLFPRGAG